MVRAISQGASDREVILIDLADGVRTLAVQTLKIYLRVEAMRTILLQEETIREDVLRATLKQLDETSANEMSPDRPSVAVLDSVLRRLVTPRSDAH